MFLRRIAIIALTAVTISFFLIATSLAQDTLLISYQGRLTDDGGNPVNGTPSMTFTIYDGAGLSKWTTSHPAVQVDNGLFDIILGSQTALPTSVFNGEYRYLGISVNGDPELSPRTLFTSVPMAAHALSAEGTGWTVSGDTIILEDGNALLRIGNNVNIDAEGRLIVAGAHLGSYGVLGHDSASVYGYTGVLGGYGVMGLHGFGTGHYGVLGEQNNGVVGYAETGGGVKGINTVSNCRGYLALDLGIGVFGVCGIADLSHPEDYAGYFMRDVTIEDGNLGIFGSPGHATEDLVIGHNIGSWNGKRLVIADDDPGVSTGLVIGEDSDTRCWMLWDVDDHFLSIGNIVAGYNWGNILTMRGPNLGIGTQNPTEELYVVGDICYTGTIGACSDRRYKSNISPLTNALDRVSNIQGVSFTWRREEYPENKFSDANQVGFIAQDLAEVLPEVVSEDDNGYYNVDYGKLTPLLVEAIKEQQELIKSQQKQIDKLKLLVEQICKESSGFDKQYGTK